MKVHITKILLGMLLGIHITCLQNSTSDTSGTTDTTPTTTEEANPDAEVLAIPSLTDILAVPSAYNDAAVPSLLKMAREDVGGASNFLGLPKRFVGLAENMSSKLLGDLLENLSPVFDAILADNPIAPGEDLLIKLTESDGPDYIRLTYNTIIAAYTYNLILYWDNAEGLHCPAIDFSFNLSDADALTTAKVMVYPAEGPADDGDSAPEKVLAEFSNINPKTITLTMTGANQDDPNGPEKIKIIVTNSSTNTIEVLGGLYASNAKTSTSGFNPFGSGDIVYSFAAIIDSAQNIAKQNMALSDAAITSVDSTFWDTYPISTAFQNGFIKYARTANGSELNCTTLGYALRGDPTYGFTPVTGNENVPSNVCSTNTSFTDAQMDQALQNYINQICKTFTAGLCGLKYVYNMKNAQCLDKDGFYGAGAICSTDAPFSGLTLDKLPLIPFDIKNLSLSDISCTTDIGEVDVTYP